VIGDVLQTERQGYFSQINVLRQPGGDFPSNLHPFIPHDLLADAKLILSETNHLSRKWD
jgi:hypothetical protein